MIDTIVVVGNGFDRWQGLQTSYADFHRYYMAHRFEILEELGIERWSMYDGKNLVFEFTDVEILFGNPFEICELDDEFWNTFESSLSYIDDENINYFFGKSKSDLRDLKRSVRNAVKILRKAFSDWVSSIEIDERQSQYRFNDSTVFINFNYTDTLVKRFQVEPDMICHVHGEATDAESIVFGHSNHPEYPYPFLKQIGGRFEGAYYIDEILYETDKHVDDNIQYLVYCLVCMGVMSEEIKHVYVLGHSFGEADLRYFAFLHSMTSIGDNNKKELHLDFLEEQFVHEQEERNRDFWDMALDKLGITQEDIDSFSPPKPRTQNAIWHITYHREEDKNRIEEVMRILGRSDYVLYDSIDKCLSGNRDILTS